MLGTLFSPTDPLLGLLPPLQWLMITSRIEDGRKEARLSNFPSVVRKFCSLALTSCMLFDFQCITSKVGIWGDGSR